MPRAPLPAMETSGETFTLIHWFSTRGILTPWGHLALAPDIFGVTTGGGDVLIGREWAEARWAAQEPTTHRTVPATENYLGPEVKSAEAVKLWKHNS